MLTTYRLTEHHTAGGMSRWLSWLSELQPEMFCEVSPELAAERGLKNGGWATIRTARGESRPRAGDAAAASAAHPRAHRSTRSGCPTTGASNGLVRGDAANDLISFVADPNVHIQESKAFTGDIVPGGGARARRAAANGFRELPELDPDARRDLPGGAGRSKEQPLQHEPSRRS